ncbi:MAG: hypothetical protein J6S04_02440 [Clostridia bacterium]|nr:hypothetical protein [Clostridia bacterium]
MKMKKAIGLVLAIASIACFAACDNVDSSSPMPSPEGIIGERVTREEFAKISSMCCDNFYTQSVTVQPLTTIGNYQMGFTETENAYYCGNLIYVEINKDVLWKVTTTDSETGETKVVESSYVEEYKYYFEKDGDRYYSYTYNESKDAWVKGENSYIETRFSYGNLNTFGETFGVDFSEEYAYFCNFDNWTYLEETGEYQLLNFQFTYGDYTTSISENVAFKDGHIVQISFSYNGGTSWTISKYSNHGQSAVTLPTNIIDNSVAE